MDDENTLLHSCFCCNYTTSFQDILLPINIYNKFENKLAQIAQVSVKDISYIGVLWPRNDSESNTVCIHSIVSSSYLPDNVCFTFNYSDIKILNPGKVVSIAIEVALDSLDDVIRYFTKNNEYDLINNIRDLLYDVVLSEDYVIHCDKMELGKLFHIKFIKILKMVFSKTDYDCGTISRKTIIYINKKQSYQDFKNSMFETVTYGLDSEIMTLKNLVKLSKSKLFIPKTVLLKGPSGCGKTTIVKQLASETNTILIHHSASMLIGSHQNETETFLVKLFEKAFGCSKYHSCILFIDDLDCIFYTKEDEYNSILIVITQLMNKVKSILNLLFIGAVNKIPETTRTNVFPKFDKEILIGIPRLNDRILIILQFLREISKHLNDIDHTYTANWLAQRTNGYSGADIKLLFSDIFRDKKKAFNIELLEKSLLKITPSSQKNSDIFIDNTQVKWDDIGSLRNVKELLKQSIEWPIKFQKKFKEFGLKPIGGILLYGPPGCAKTKLVKAAACSSNFTFLAISAAQLYSPFVGDSEKKLLEIFNQARAGAPTILFIDEIDAIVGSRDFNSKKSDVHERVLSTLLNEMDGIGTRKEQLQRLENPFERDVILVGATNRPNKVDAALLRPGRFDKLIYVQHPDIEARKSILKIYIDKMPCSNIDVDELAKVTEFCTGADLENLCMEAALLAITENNDDVNKIDFKYFQKAVLNIRRSLIFESIEFYKNFNKQKH